MTPSHGIDFDQYKTQSKDLLKQARAGDPEALLRLRTHHPEGELLVKMPRLQLADAQLAIARENEFPSWAKFKEHILLENANSIHFELIICHNNISRLLGMRSYSLRGNYYGR